MDERARFEEWASDGGLYPRAVERSGDGYLLAVTQAYWQVWKARSPKQVELTDERIDYIADLVVKGMPDGIQGFCKSWGWRQFARAILADCAGYTAKPQEQP